jgi:hydroxypyruvate isomerase
MPKSAANLSMLFTELPFLDRFEAAAAAGFEGVEFLFPYEQRLISRRASRPTACAKSFSICRPAIGRTVGIAIYPNLVRKFRDSVAQTVQYAKAPGCTQLHCLAGKAPNYLKFVAHVQVAATPGRHEPGTGEINFPFIFEHLDNIGYRGWIGCEYQPCTLTDDSLAWFRGLKSNSN